MIEYFFIDFFRSCLDGLARERTTPRAKNYLSYRAFHHRARRIDKFLRGDEPSERAVREMCLYSRHLVLFFPNSTERSNAAATVPIL